LALIPSATRGWSTDTVMRRVQCASVTSQLLHVIVNGFRKVIMRDAGLLVEDQVMPDASKLLKVRGDGLHVGFRTPLAFLFPLIRFRGGSVFGFGHATSKRPRHRDANYQSVGAGNGVKPLAVAGVEKSVSEQGAESMPGVVLSAIHDVSETRTRPAQQLP
jgi:hypothetical protein